MDTLKYRKLFPRKTMRMSNKDIRKEFGPAFGDDDPFLGSSYVFSPGPFPQLETPEVDVFLVGPKFYMTSPEGGHWDEFGYIFACDKLYPQLGLKLVMPGMYQCTTVDHLTVKQSLLDSGMTIIRGKFGDGRG